MSEIGGKEFINQFNKRVLIRRLGERKSERILGFECLELRGGLVKVYVYSLVREFNIGGCIYVKYFGIMGQEFRKDFSFLDFQGVQIERCLR